MSTVLQVVVSEKKLQESRFNLTAKLMCLPRVNIYFVLSILPYSCDTIHITNKTSYTCTFLLPYVSWHLFTFLSTLSNVKYIVSQYSFYLGFVYLTGCSYGKFCLRKEKKAKDGRARDCCLQLAEMFLNIAFVMYSLADFVNLMWEHFVRPYLVTLKCTGHLDYFNELNVYDI